MLGIRTQDASMASRYGASQHCLSASPQDTRMIYPVDPRAPLALLERELTWIEALARRDMTPELRAELEQLFAELDELQREWGPPTTGPGNSD